jgi:hypothetical protein
MHFSSFNLALCVKTKENRHFFAQLPCPDDLVKPSYSLFPPELGPRWDIYGSWDFSKKGKRNLAALLR